MKTTPLILIAACSSFAFLSCQEKGEPEAATIVASPTTTFESIFLKTEPADAQSIAEARPTMEVGNPIILKGKVMGRKDPFVEGRAMVVLGDPDKLTSCDLHPGDQCQMPWDVCCDDPDDIKNFTTTVQVLDADGKLIKQGLKGINGVNELAHLVVTGTVAEGSNADNLLINATGIYVQP